MAFNGGEITPSRILALCETRDPEDVASILNIPQSQVDAVLNQNGKLRRWVVRCNKTGRTAGARSERGAYRTAHLLGCTDWDCWPEGAKPKAAPVAKLPRGAERDQTIRMMAQAGAKPRAIAEAIGGCPKRIREKVARFTFVNP